MLQLLSFCKIHELYRMSLATMPKLKNEREHKYNENVDTIFYFEIQSL